MEATRHLYSFLAMVKKEFKILTRYPLNFIGGFIQVFFLILMFLYSMIPFSSGSESLSSGPALLWGSMFFFFVSDSLWAIGTSVRWEQVSGTLEQLYLTPSKQWLILLARGLRSYLVDLPLVLWLILVVYMVTGYFEAKNPLLGVYILLLSIAGLTGLGYAYAGMVLALKRTANLFTNMFQFIFLIFCAMFFPFKALPEKVLAVSRLIPISYMVDCFRSVMTGSNPELITGAVRVVGFTFTPLFFELVIVHLMAIVLPVVGFKLYNRMIKKALREGTLGQY